MYYSFKNLPTCFYCGALPDGSTTCSNCVEKYAELEDKRGKIRKRKHLAWNNTPLAVFNKLYDDTLEKYVLHRFKFLILSKQFVIDVRQKRLKPGEVCMQHDFSECLKIVHNEEVCITCYCIICVISFPFLLISANLVACSLSSSLC